MWVYQIIDDSESMSINLVFQVGYLVSNQFVCIYTYKDRELAERMCNYLNGGPGTFITFGQQVHTQTDT